MKTQISMRLHDRRVIDINKTVSHLGNCCKDLLPMHALSGCDTVSYRYGKGKITAVNLLLKNNLNLEQMCDGNTPILTELAPTFWSVCMEANQEMISTTSGITCLVRGKILQKLNVCLQLMNLQFIM